MPTPFNQYYSYAQLALASYTDFDGNVNSFRQALGTTNGGMGASQAAQFVQRYQVLDQYNESHTVELIDPTTGTIQQLTVTNGLSVTLFARIDENGNPTGEQVVAIRGTQDFPDLITDISDIALAGTFKTQAQYLSLKEKIQEWLGSGKLQSGFSVTGHSLGGFLAVGLTADFGVSISHTYLYNTPGLGGVAGSIRGPLSAMSTVLDALQVRASINATKVTSLRTSGVRSRVVACQEILNNCAMHSARRPLSAREKKGSGLAM